MSNQFLLGHNLDYLYNNVRVNVKSDIKYDLDSNSQYKTILIPKLASVILNKYRNYDITDLNELAIKATTEHIIKTRQKKTVTETEIVTETNTKTNTNTFYEEDVVDINSFSRNNLDLLDVQVQDLNNGYLITEHSPLLNSDTNFNEQIMVDNKITEDSFPFHNQVNSNKTKLIDKETEIFESKTINKETYYEDEDEEDAEFFKKLIEESEELLVNTQHNQLPKPIIDEEYKSEIDPRLFKLGLIDTKVRNTIKDQSSGNIIEGYNPDLPINSNPLTSTNLDYNINLHSNKFSNKQPYMVILDVLPTSGTFTAGNEFKNLQCRLINTFTLNSKYDVFLEFISLHDIVGATVEDNIENYHSFILKINELRSLNTLSNNNQFVDSLIIPNDTYGISNLESSIVVPAELRPFPEISPDTVFTHSTEQKVHQNIAYDAATRTLTFKATFDSGTSLVLTAGEKLSFTFTSNGAGRTGNYTGTVETNVTITSDTNSQSIKFDHPGLLNGDGNALTNSVTNDIFSFLGSSLSQSVGNTTSASKKLTSMVVRLKSNYICTQEASTFRDFTVSLRGVKASDSITTSAGILKAHGSTTRLQIGLFFKPH